jgi:hydroxymethylglutaryl-CoA reductase (NADPH)
MEIPSLLLKNLYTNGSLKNTEHGVAFSLKNRLTDAKLQRVVGVKINGNAVEVSGIDTGDGNVQPVSAVTPENPFDFPLKKVVTLFVKSSELPVGKYTLTIAFEASPFGKLEFSIDDSIQQEHQNRVKIPRNDEDDYGDSAIKARQQFVKDYSGVELQHVDKYSFDPHITQGNCEHFIGVAQVPIGIAGPLLVNGEHAKGEFLIPMATAEGTLIASYNRGMQVINLSGGVKCTVVGDDMQRAPVFVFEDARGAREFCKWVEANKPQIAKQAEATSSIAKLHYIDYYLINLLSCASTILQAMRQDKTW